MRAGLENREVAASLAVAENTVSKRRRRFVAQRMDGLRDEARSGARSIEDKRSEVAIVKTLESWLGPKTEVIRYDLCPRCGSDN